MAPETVILDEDGMLDMEQFPDDGTEVDSATESDVREALLSDPVAEPSDQVWEDMFDHALAEAEPTGPFASDPADLGPDPVDPVDDGGEVVGLVGEGAHDPGVGVDDTDVDGPDDIDDGDLPVDPAEGAGSDDVDLDPLDPDALLGDAGAEDDRFSDVDGGSDVLEDPGDTLEDFS